MTIASAFDVLTDMELTRILERRGYVVRHESEVRHPLTWNRTAPFPPGVDFKAEALVKLREQISPEMIRYRSDTIGTLPPIHRAMLRVLY